MDTSTTGNTGRVRVKNHTSRQLLDRQPTMHNVKITPVNSGYQLMFSQFSSDVYPNTSCTETIIAANATNRQKLFIFPINRQLQCREGRQWKITGLTTFDVEYRGQTARVEALVSPTFEDGISLGWATLRDHISGPDRDHIHFDNYPKTPSTKQNNQQSHTCPPAAAPRVKECTLGTHALQQPYMFSLWKDRATTEAYVGANRDCKTPQACTTMYNANHTTAH